MPEKESIHKRLYPAVESLDWAGCETILEELPYAARQKELRRALIRLVESGRVVVRRESVDRQETRRRDSFVEQMLTYAGRLKARDVRRDCKEALATARILDEGYREIRTLLSRSAARDLTPAEHAWALLKMTARELGRIQDDLKSRLSSGEEIADLYGMSIGEAPGSGQRPDAMIGGMISALGLSLQMLAYDSGWFAESGHIDLPQESEVSEEAIEKAAATMVLGNSWLALNAVEERWRFFGRKVWLGPIEGTEPGLQSRSIGGEPEGDLDLLGRIADERISQLLLRVHSDMMVEANPIEDAYGCDGIALPPEAFLDQSERDFAETLESLLHVPVLTFDAKYGGLSFAEWMRGYCILRALSIRLCDGESKGAVHVMLTVRNMSTRMRQWAS